VSKLFGYDFSVQYRQGKLNVFADALSRRHEETMGVHAISSPSFAVFDALRHELMTDTEAWQLRATLAAGTMSPGWSVIDGLRLFKGCTLLLVESPL
jgi:hypothetical protein